MAWGGGAKGGRLAARGRSARLGDRLRGRDNADMDAPSEQDLTYLARLNFRNDGRLFGIRRRDRRFHTYIVGKTGTGKSTLLEFLIRQDVLRGEGLAPLPLN